MKVFISYHRADEKYRKNVEEILHKFNIHYYAVPNNVDFDGKNHHHIKDLINENMEDCDVLLCIVGEETYSRPHVDWELHEALKGGENRKGILAVMLEKRKDSKNNINYNTFPNRLEDNENYIIIEQYASLHDKIVDALNAAIKNRDDQTLSVNNKREPMTLRQGKYYDN